MVAAAWALGLPPSALASVVPLAGEVADRIQRAAARSRAVPARQTIRRRECRAPLRPGPLPPWIFAHRSAAWPCWTVGLGQGTASDPCGPGAWCWQARCHCRTVGLQVRGLLCCRPVVTPPGSGLVQGIPAGAAQVRLQAARPSPQPGALVSACGVGAPPQGGWRLGVRADRVRQQWPGRAAACRPVLPPGVGLPPRCVLGVSRHPLRLGRACPVTVRLRVPVPWAPVVRRVQQWAVSGCPLPCLRSCQPSSQGCHVQERLGLPTCCHAALPAGHGRRTPADLPRLALTVGRGWPAGACQPSASAPRLCAAVPALQGARAPLRPPGGSVYASPLLGAACTTTTPPWTPDALRVGGSPFPDRDGHPARDAKLFLAR